MKVFLTGASGFIAKSVLDLAPSNWSIITTDIFDSDVNCDLADLRVEDIPIDTDLIIHLGAVVDTRFADEKLLEKININPNRIFCQFLSKHIHCRLVFASSAAVYGRLKAPNCVDGVTNPLNLYGKSKLDAEGIILEQESMIRERCVCLRFFNVYGFGEQHKDVMASMLFQLSRDMIINRKETILFKYGDQKRDFVHVTDVARAVIAAADEANVSGTIQVYNVGSGRSVSFNTVLHLLIENWCKTDLIDEKDLRKTNYIDCPYEFFQTHTEAALSENFNWFPILSIEKGIEKYVGDLADLWSLPVNYKRSEHGVIEFVPGTSISYDNAYIDSYKKLPLSSEMSFLRLGALITALKVNGKKLENVLDVGYGDGSFLRAALKTGALCSGTDISGCGVPLGAKQVSCDKWQDEPFQVITFFDSLEHFPKIDFVENLNCEFVFISLPNCYYTDKTWFENWKHRKPGEHIWHFNEYTLELFFNRMGFVSVSPCLLHEDIIRKNPEQVEPNILCRLFRKIN
jgi:ADP-L-glycero-D-manno-heptose 6-epimerase